MNDMKVIPLTTDESLTLKMLKQRIRDASERTAQARQIEDELRQQYDSAMEKASRKHGLRCSLSICGEYLIGLEDWTLKNADADSRS